MEPSLITLVDSFLGDLQAKGGGDLIEDFASAIPVEAIGNLLGVPQADRAPSRRWSLVILGALEPKLAGDQEALDNRNVLEFTAYLKTLVPDRRKNPGDPDRDVLTRLISGEVGGKMLREAELLKNCVFILNPGHETTPNLIGNALLAFTKHPRAKAELLLKQKLLTHDSVGRKADLIPIIDEFLRFEPANQLSNRSALKDTQIGDMAIAASSLLTLCIGAANRDTAQFEQPNRLLLERQNNRFLAFGLGIHQCAGMSMVRHNVNLVDCVWAVSIMVSAVVFALGLPPFRHTVGAMLCWALTACANESPLSFLTTRSCIAMSLGAKAPETFKETLGLGIEQSAGMRLARLDVPHCRIEL